MTSTLGTDQLFTDRIVDHPDREDRNCVGTENGLQLPYLDLDDPDFTWPSQPPVSLPLRATANRTGEAATELKRNRGALRGQVNDVEHFPTRRSLRAAQALETRAVTTGSQAIAPTTVIVASHVAESYVDLASDRPRPDVLVDDAMDREALAEDLEAALLAALEEAPELEEPIVRKQRIALARARSEPVAKDQADSEYLTKIKTYGPFPLLRPSLRDFRPILAISIFLGVLGADRFYSGKPISGTLKLATAGGLGVWWIIDIISILRGRTVDKDGHRFTGEKKYRAAAWLLTMTLFAGLALFAVTAATPAVTAGIAKAHEVLFPKSAPVPTWAEIANIKGTADPVIFNVTGDQLRLSYSFPGPAYAFLQKIGDAAVPAEALLLKDTKSDGVKEVPVTPGKYQLVVRADGAWTAKVEELGVHG
ncbi:hypothetical protein GCM10023063_18970 [Arthrobacter methylotrophus]|uniref:TM2 domain-containing protein n=1 Tax=Arthrobacter methylotrophus TaxID=121291 RepID=A0ABV5UP59_9MICC